MNSKGYVPKCLIVKLSKAEDKETVRNTAHERVIYYVPWITNRIKHDFQSEIMKLKADDHG